MDSNSSQVLCFVAPVTKDSKLQVACLLPPGSAIFIPALECSQTCISQYESVKAKYPVCLPRMTSGATEAGILKGWHHSPEISTFL